MPPHAAAYLLVTVTRVIRCLAELALCMYRCAVRQYHPLYIAKSSFFLAPASLGLAYRSIMSDPLHAGQTRSQPDSESPFPIGKKPRLEMSYDTIDSVGKKLAANTSLKKSAKKEARKAKKKGQHVLPEPYSTDDVLWRDVISVLGQNIVDNIIEEGTEWNSPFEFREEVEVEVHSLSSNGVCRLAWVSGL